MSGWTKSDEIQFSIDNILETIVAFERDIQSAEKQLLQCRHEYNVCSRKEQSRVIREIEFLEKTGIPRLRETHAMLKEDVGIFKLQLETGMSYEEAENRLKDESEQPTLF
ncbi:hypothetical protein GCM10008014_08560 [Paenibacillus silvae]|uniref:Uncharacterized protein n=1 Tax=Paenibacillus silvae TaxID=1325358 RepID=A0ABQ1Z128_9BACL|nr:hypothetical protein [Paenibacillus silvae]GGH46113.1 hypothetical protein GCM10008014_08560 [Paenibacillus silvae]